MTASTAYSLPVTFMRLAVNDPFGLSLVWLVSAARKFFVCSLRRMERGRRKKVLKVITRTITVVKMTLATSGDNLVKMKPKIEVEISAIAC